MKTLQELKKEIENIDITNDDLEYIKNEILDNIERLESEVNE